MLLHLCTINTFLFISYFRAIVSVSSPELSLLLFSCFQLRVRDDTLTDRIGSKHQLQHNSHTHTQSHTQSPCLIVLHTGSNKHTQLLPFFLTPMMDHLSTTATNQGERDGGHTPGPWTHLHCCFSDFFSLVLSARLAFTTAV
ncbi:hypothetical protein ILYODFUR_012269 [Ilyodon furcidens]|uniref:Secreted protein n=1 Tax=Ilyodon furcidens TaxID=33524 RepID=A0ABV0SKP3_9TELE